MAAILYMPSGGDVGVSVETCATDDVAVSVETCATCATDDVAVSVETFATDDVAVSVETCATGEVGGDFILSTKITN